MTTMQDIIRLLEKSKGKKNYLAVSFNLPHYGNSFTCQCLENGTYRNVRTSNVLDIIRLDSDICLVLTQNFAYITKLISEAKSNVKICFIKHKPCVGKNVEIYVEYLPTNNSQGITWTTQHLITAPVQAASLVSGYYIVETQGNLYICCLKES